MSGVEGMEVETGGDIVEIVDENKKLGLVKGKQSWRSSRPILGSTRQGRRKLLTS